MSNNDLGVSITRRDLLRMIGMTAGGAAMYQAMSSLGFAAESPYKGPIKLEGAPKGASVLVLGAGLAGMTAAYELRKAGYKVTVLEYNNRPGGRNWSLYGGDTYTELGGFTQHCQFDKGHYLNPGPWRIPHHHTGVLSYCKQFGVALEPFIMVNYNAYIHNSKAFGGKPQRFRAVRADYHGHIAELLAKSAQQHKLDDLVSEQDLQILLESLRSWGALDQNFAYTKGAISGNRRGYKKPPGGGLTARPEFEDPINFSDLLHSRAWADVALGEVYRYQSTIFQPVGGMGMIGKAFGRELGDVIRYNSKVTEIKQDNKGVTVHYEDTTKPDQTLTAQADWCVCTIPLTILNQIQVSVSPAMKAAISAVPYGTGVKIGLQFKRRFWEEDEHIYGGITYTDLPIYRLGYPNSDYYSSGKGVIVSNLGSNLSAQEFTAMSPEQRTEAALAYGSQIHPQYRKEFDNAVSVAWHRVPFTQGCSGRWTPELRAQHYDNLCQIDNRIVLAGEHASYLGSWQEGAITSALDAIGRLHQKIVATGRT